MSWNADATANRFRSSYINGFFEVSGNFIVSATTRNNTITTTTGTNLISANGANGKNRITSSGAGSYNEIYGNQNYIVFDNSGGQILLRGYDGGSTYTDKITINSTQTTINNNGIQLSASAAVGGYLGVFGRYTYYDATVEHLLRIGNPAVSVVNKIVVNSTNTAINNNKVDLNANIAGSGGLNLYNQGGGITINSQTDGVYIQAPAGASNAVNKIICGSENTTITNTSININGAFNITNSGASSIRLNGGNGGNYIAYHPQIDGGNGSRKAYVGFPGLGNTDFVIASEYGASSKIIINNDGSHKFSASTIETKINNRDIYMNCNDRFDVNCFNNRQFSTGTHFFYVNNNEKLVINSSNINLTNTYIDFRGSVYHYCPGGPSINMVGTGVGGLYTTYFPDGLDNGRKAYVGYPGGGSTEFVIQNDYANGSIGLGIAGTGTINLNSTIMKKNNIVYPNIQVQWQTLDIPWGLNYWYNMTNNYSSNGNFGAGEANYIKFPFDTRCNWIMISFESQSFNGFNARELQIRFLSSGGAAWAVGTTGAILGNSDRAQYIQCYTNVVLPYNTELTPQFLYTGASIGGSFYAKQFTATFNFTQQ